MGKWVHQCEHSPLPHPFARVKPNVLRSDGGGLVRWRRRCYPGVSISCQRKDTYVHPLPIGLPFAVVTLVCVYACAGGVNQGETLSQIFSGMNYVFQVCWCNYFILQIKGFNCPTGTKYFFIPTKYKPSKEVTDIYYASYIIPKYGLPVLVTAIGTGLLVRFLQKQKNVRKAMLSEGPHTNRRKHGEPLDNLTVCLVAIAVCFFVFLIPFTVLASMQYTKIKTCTYLRILPSGVLLALLNSSVNFLIYFWLLPPFKKAIRGLCGGQESREQTNPSISTVSIENNV